MADGWLSHAAAHWVDSATAIVAMIYAAFQRTRSRAPPPFLSRRTGWDILNGLALFPLILLMGSCFSDYLTAELVGTNKVIMFGAGALALFAILEDTGAQPET